MIKGYKYRIYPNKYQRILIAKHFGCVRWFYNYALANKIESWVEYHASITRYDIDKVLPLLKKDAKTAWLSEVNAQSLQASLMNMDNAFKNFFKSKKGFPKFKSKHDNHQSFTVPQYFSINQETSKIHIPKFTPIKIKIDREFKGKPKQVTISQTPSGKYYASVLIDDNLQLPDRPIVTANTTLGLDLGIKDFITLSDGREVEAIKTTKKFAKKLSKAQRNLSRKVKGSSNRNKARIKVAKIYEKIANTRKDFHHKLSHQLTHESQVDTIVVEDLNIAGMVKNRCLSKAISDCGWSEFIRQLEYKSDWYGKNLIKIGRFEPSSKLCSDCGTINKELTLANRNWVCPNCGVEHDRDINAAINIKAIGLNPLAILSERQESTLTETTSCNSGR